MAAPRSDRSLPRLLDRALQYLADPDSSTPYAPDPIWLMGTLHPGSPSGAPPPDFLADFCSRPILTYRTAFPPIPPSHQATLPDNPFLAAVASFTGRSQSKSAGLTQDTGWGCMLRTGQSLLANALAIVHLGRRPPSTSDPVYIRILSWFIDHPSPIAPFSVHRFAFQGSKLGKHVGEWFGPSTAAHAIKNLVQDFPPADMGVCIAIDSAVYKSQVADASYPPFSQPVLLLLPLRLGLDRVTPLYIPAIKALFTFPQSIGIAGGRPASSYYFVASQADQLVYVDPHHPQKAIPLRSPPQALYQHAVSDPLNHPSPALNSFYQAAYSPEHLQSFHCTKPRKMNVGALDPSMLVGILIKDEADWQDFANRCKEIAKTHTPIFHVADEMPAWMRSANRRHSSPTSPVGMSENSADNASFDDSDDWDISDTNSIDFDDNQASSMGDERGRMSGTPDTLAAGAVMINSPVEGSSPSSGYVLRA